MRCRQYPSSYGHNPIKVFLLLSRLGKKKKKRHVAYTILTVGHTQLKCFGGVIYFSHLQVVGDVTDELRDKSHEIRFRLVGSGEREHADLHEVRVSLGILHAGKRKSEKNKNEKEDGALID